MVILIFSQRYDWFAILIVNISVLFLPYRKGMNVNAVLDLPVRTAKKSMLVLPVRVQTMAFVLIYLRDMMETHTNVFVRMVSKYILFYNSFCI